MTSPQAAVMRATRVRFFATCSRAFLGFLAPFSVRQWKWRWMTIASLLFGGGVAWGEVNMVSIGIENHVHAERGEIGMLGAVGLRVGVVVNTPLEAQQVLPPVQDRCTRNYSDQQILAKRSYINGGALFRLHTNRDFGLRSVCGYQRHLHCAQHVLCDAAAGIGECYNDIERVAKVEFLGFGFDGRQDYCSTMALERDAFVRRASLANIYDGDNDQDRGEQWHRMYPGAPPRARPFTAYAYFVFGSFIVWAGFGAITGAPSFRHRPGLIALAGVLLVALGCYVACVGATIIWSV